jgi:hypothetical protein
MSAGPMRLPFGRFRRTRANLPQRSNNANLNAARLMLAGVDLFVQARSPTSADTQQGDSAGQA